MHDCISLVALLALQAMRVNSMELARNLHEFACITKPHRNLSKLYDYMHYCNYCNYMHFAELYEIVPFNSADNFGSFAELCRNWWNSDSSINETLSELSRDLAEISWNTENTWTSPYMCFGTFQESKNMFMNFLPRSRKSTSLERSEAHVWRCWCIWINYPVG